MLCCTTLCCAQGLAEKAAQKVKEILHSGRSVRVQRALSDERRQVRAC